MPTISNPPHTVDSLLRVVEAYEAKVALLKLLIDKVKLQVLRRDRARFGALSEQLNSPQIALIEGQPPDELLASRTPPKKDAANTPEPDRKLPAHRIRPANSS